MGQKTHPVGFRLGYNVPWASRWFNEKNFAKDLKEDIAIRKYIRSRLDNADVSRVEIERASNRVTLIIYTARPGLVIGQKGQKVDQLRDELQHITGREVYITIQEVKVAELDAELVGQRVAKQLASRISFRRATKRAIAQAIRFGAKGIRIRVSGRLGGAEMARTHTVREGRVPLHTLRADIDYAQVTARTTYGTIGVKVWICKGEAAPL